MGNFLRLTNGVPRSFAESGTTLPTIYDQPLTLVASAPGANQVIGPITSGTAITLPASATYTSDELEVFLNGQKMENGYDYNYVGSAPRSQITFTFNLVVGDRLHFQKFRNF